MQRKLLRRPQRLKLQARRYPRKSHTSKAILKPSSVNHPQLNQVQRNKPKLPQTINSTGPTSPTLMALAITLNLKLRKVPSQSVKTTHSAAPRTSTLSSYPAHPSPCPSTKTNAAGSIASCPLSSMVTGLIALPNPTTQSGSATSQQTKDCGSHLSNSDGHL